MPLLREVVVERTSEVKIFAFDDRDYYAAVTETSAREKFLADSGFTPEDWDDCEVRELSEAELGTLMFRDEDAEPITPPEVCLTSFRERLRELKEEGVEFPCFFATSEF